MRNDCVPSRDVCDVMGFEGACGLPTDVKPTGTDGTNEGCDSWWARADSYASSL